MSRRGASSEVTGALGQRLKELRLRRGWSQDELAKKVGVQQKQISSYERGANTPSGEIFVALADAFDVSLDYLAQRTASDSTSMPIADMELLERARRIDRMDEEDRLLIKHVMDLLIMKTRFKEIVEHAPKTSGLPPVQLGL